ncbi:translation elongation factor Ts [Ruminiclostridium papyrosolvens DSM 2782]|uniref:Elongation factor Ts n=1 Tax=Ruminiclostridium papyrosolvens DSM 2782 TaxID=588581 RepID=F1TG35_9FIRM|nr:translation elongation factor Ts [Ruminiclostridium papyrosolvens]EGD46654.1 translation elongation factor Ts [Ruminiclostridium papyrosolvens DSM 2782]WES35805.1 translation elongation factor Ts [Ruminiclostridium papyrosolvens DSM 2782]
MITAEMVKQLRERTGAGMMDCKRALNDANGDAEKAIELLREKGLSAAAKKAGRIAAEGLVEAYIHGDGRIGVLVEVNIETDFAARGDEFKQFVKDIAMQIAASKPEFVKKEDVPASVIESEKEILRAQARNEGKPEKIIDKMVEGRIEKFYAENCLMEQAFIKDPDMTVGQLLTEKIAHIGENISIRRFARFERGEGIEKKDENFADEVMKQING